MGKELVKARS
jgi:hypothetical protein